MKLLSVHRKESDTSLASAVKVSVFFCSIATKKVKSTSQATYNSNLDKQHGSSKGKIKTGTGGKYVFLKHEFKFFTFPIYRCGDIGQSI